MRCHLNMQQRGFQVKTRCIFPGQCYLILCNSLDFSLIYKNHPFEIYKNRNKIIIIMVEKSGQEISSRQPLVMENKRKSGIGLKIQKLRLIIGYFFNQTLFYQTPYILRENSCPNVGYIFMYHNWECISIFNFYDPQYIFLCPAIGLGSWLRILKKMQVLCTTSFYN